MALLVVRQGKHTVVASEQRGQPDSFKWLANKQELYRYVDTDDDSDAVTVQALSNSLCPLAVAPVSVFPSVRRRRETWHMGRVNVAIREE